MTIQTVFTPKILRMDRGLRQKDVADKMGVTRQTIINWESGSKKISLRDAVKLSKIYKVDLTDLADIFYS